ncbi:hypothetical protein Q3G72_027721 [Acer saccharum]|nr:hypothetical protein Q3G72_027721 [Acer saccharum]
MAISKTLISLLLLVLVLVLAQSNDDLLTVMRHVVLGASYRLGHDCAREHVGLAVLAVIVFLQGPLVTMMLAPATLI